MLAQDRPKSHGMTTVFKHYGVKYLLSIEKDFVNIVFYSNLMVSEPT